MKLFLIIFLTIMILPVFAPSHPEYVGVASPLKQIKAGVALEDVICSEGKVPAFKYNAMRVACVSLETESQLILRGWALLRLYIHSDEPTQTLCERYSGNWLAEFRECEKISQEQCSLIGGKYSECESACRNDPAAEVCTTQCVMVCKVSERFPEFAVSFSRVGGIAGITQSVSIDSGDHLIEISGFNPQKLGPMSRDNMQSLWDTINQNKFFELESRMYPPVAGSADYFTYTLEIESPPIRKGISWTDTSENYPEELRIIQDEINRLIKFYSEKLTPTQEYSYMPEPRAEDYCSGTAGCFFGTVTKVIDGDTILVDGQSIRFALASTPELNEFGGIEAKKFVEKICPVGSRALVDEDDGQTQGSYGRIIGVIICNESNLNEAVLEEGHGVLSSGFCSTSEFAGEDWAQKHGCVIQMEKESRSTTPSSQPAQPSCDPSYPDFCIPPPPPDLDCGDISQKRFTVLQPDPHRFDGDKDGIGCES
jgi:micrococcal nuclease